MSTEYQVKYPVWIDGKGEYALNRQKSKILAYAAKCHSPIFGQEKTTTTETKDVVKPEILEKVAHDALLRDEKKRTAPANVENSPKKTRRVKSGSTKRVVHSKPSSQTRAKCSPRITRELSPKISKTSIKMSLPTSEYLKLLCNVDNARPSFKKTAY